MKTFKEFLNESPLYHDKELDTKLKIKHPINDKSVENLKSAFKFIGSIEGLEIWHNETTFIVGEKYTSDEHGELFSIGMLIRTRGSKIFPAPPSNLILGKTTFQVSWAEISSDFENTGIAKKVYLKIIDHVGSITSDNEQYRGAKRLWKSLSRNVKVHVWDSLKNDYIKDSNGKILTIKDVNESKIWGSSPEFRNLLLVATNH